MFQAEMTARRLASMKLRRLYYQLADRVRIAARIRRNEQEYTMKLYRHGDVLIGKVRKVPEDARRLKHLTLAEGEVTGHSHRILQRDSAELYRYSGELFLKVIATPSTVVHQEHGPIELSKGVYRVWRQREYTPERIITVRD